MSGRRDARVVKKTGDSGKIRIISPKQTDILAFL